MPNLLVDSIELVQPSKLDYWLCRGFQVLLGGVLVSGVRQVIFFLVMAALAWRGTLSGSVLMASLCVLAFSLWVMTFGARLRKSLYCDCLDIFPSKAQAGRVLSHSYAVIKRLDGASGVDMLEHIVQSLRRAYHLLPSDVKNTSELLSDDDSAAFNTVMTLTLRGLMESKLDSNGAANTTLTPVMQQYLLAFFPDIALSWPLLFDAEHLDSWCPGLYARVNTLSALNYSSLELTWLANEYVDAAKKTLSASTDPTLPDLMC